ncbi:MAG: hypothetical protein ACF8XB_14075 [Planctomycetota bacterium JB042]
MIADGMGAPGLTDILTGGVSVGAVIFIVLKFLAHIREERTALAEERALDRKETKEAIKTIVEAHERTNNALVGQVSELRSEVRILVTEVRGKDPV